MDDPLISILKKELSLNQFDALVSMATADDMTTAQFVGFMTSALSRLRTFTPEETVEKLGYPDSGVHVAHPETGLTHWIQVKSSRK